MRVPNFLLLCICAVALAHDDVEPDGGTCDNQGACFSKENVSERVSAMYNAVPFPGRHTNLGAPALAPERRLGQYVGPSILADVDHHVFGGRISLLSHDSRVHDTIVRLHPLNNALDLSEFQHGTPKLFATTCRKAGQESDTSMGLNILFAGGGTGFTAIQFAKELCNAGVSFHITLVDITHASIDIAKQDVAAIGLSQQFTIIEHSLSSPSLVDAIPTAPFDYIDCAGVLHHMDKPVAAIKNLAAMLKPQGGMGLMLYSKFARAGAVAMQAAFQHLNSVSTGQTGKATSAGPSETQIQENLLYLQEIRAHMTRHQSLIPEKTTTSDLVDTFLHEFERDYTVDDIFDLLIEADLCLTSFATPMLYTPSHLFPSNAAIQTKIALIPPTRAHALAELLIGSSIDQNHVFYAAHAPHSRVFASQEGETRGDEDQGEGNVEDSTTPNAWVREKGFCPKNQHQFLDLAPPSPVEHRTVLVPRVDKEFLLQLFGEALRSGSTVNLNMKGYMIHNCASFKYSMVPYLIAERMDGLVSLGEIYLELCQSTKDDATGAPVAFQIYQESAMKLYSCLHSMGFMTLKQSPTSMDDVDFQAETSDRCSS